MAVAQGDRVIVMYETDGELTRTRQLDATTGQRVMRARCGTLVRELVRTGDEIEYLVPARRAGVAPVRSRRS